MKGNLLLIFIFSSLFCFSQKKFELVSDSISVTYLIREDSVCFSEEVQIRNISHNAIYIPDINNRDLYFFTLGSTLFSYFGAMASKIGTPNLSLEMRLIKIPPKEKFDLTVKIAKANKRITNYCFSFDYLKSLGSDRQNSALIISMEKYIDLYKYVIGNIEDK